MSDNSSYENLEKLLKSKQRGTLYCHHLLVPGAIAIVQQAMSEIQVIADNDYLNPEDWRFEATR